MKKILVVVALSFTLLLGLAFGATGIMNDKTLASTEEVRENILSVKGEGIVKIKPDVAYVNIGVESQNKVSQNAQKDNAKKMDAVIKSLKEKGIKEDEIKTISYNISPIMQYNENTRKSEITGYKVENQVQVTINDITKVGNIIDTVSGKGANLIRNIIFGTTKQDEYYNQALQLAAKNAKGKADALAKAVGVTVSKPLRVIENSYGGYTMLKADTSFRNMNAKEFSVETPISSGELEIRASVNIEYKY
ncbi:SIMPL domain-containing protein [Clostridiaceae bacterium M8S5]|nr:SIMPL domain-containing protein [Clostridiaceae bacterium M8S5]